MNMQNRCFKAALVFSTLAGACTVACYGQFFSTGCVDVILPENWQRMSAQEKLDSLGGLLSEGSLFIPISEIEQFKIRRQLKKMIVNREDAVLGDGFNYRFGFRYDLGWEELSLLGLVGFASVWMLYVAARTILLLVPTVKGIRFRLLPSDGRRRSLNVDKRRETSFFPVLRGSILVFSFPRNAPKNLESREPYGSIENGKDPPSPGPRKGFGTFRLRIQHLCENSFHF
jgi:hypothetical protein